MKKILPFFIFAILFAGYFHEITAITQDLGRHLLMGKIIIQNWSVPQTNLFSYTYPNFPFINHHWLSEVVFYQIVELFGFLGLLITTTVIVQFAFLLIFLKVKKVANIYVLSIASLLYFPVLFERTELRPELFSFLFLAIFVTILYRFREKFTWWIFILPFIELLWINMHIYFIIGFVVLFLFLIDAAYTLIQHKLSNKQFLILLIASLLSLIATVVNPNGLSGALYPFRIFQNYGYSIEENQTIFFLWNYSQKPTIAFFVLATIFLFLLLLLTFRKTRPIDWLLSISFTVLAVLAVRNFPLFVFATFIPFTRSLTIVGEKLYTALKKDLPVKRFLLVRYSFFFLLLATLTWQLVSTISAKPISASVPIGAKKAADFFIDNHLKGPLFNNFDIGSYLDYRLYPKERVFVDGRPEAYPASFFQNEYISMQENPSMFEEKAKKYHINTIFFAHTDQTHWAETFLKSITASSDWTIVYIDDYVVTLVKNIKENQSLIKKFGMKKGALYISNYQLNNFRSLLQLAHFLTITNEKQQAIKVLRDLLVINPTFCPALYNLSVLTRDKSNIAAIYSSQFIKQCQ